MGQTLNLTMVYREEQGPKADLVHMKNSWGQRASYSIEHFFKLRHICVLIVQRGFSLFLCIVKLFFRSLVSKSMPSGDGEATPNFKVSSKTKPKWVFSYLGIYLTDKTHPLRARICSIKVHKALLRILRQNRTWLYKSRNTRFTQQSTQLKVPYYSSIMSTLHIKNLEERSSAHYEEIVGILWWVILPLLLNDSNH